MGPFSAIPNLIAPELLQEPPGITVNIQEPFKYLIENAIPSPTKTPGITKDIVEVAELIEIATKDYEKRFGTTKEAQVDFVFERPDIAFSGERLGFSFPVRQPGAFGGGRPFESKTKNLRPVLREVADDPDNPGYKKAVLGYWYDNIIRITCWARNNKTVLKRAIWVENMMEEYTWWFVRSGTNRIFYEGWQPSVFLDINNDIYFGRPIDYYVKTEKLIHISEKTLEEIEVTLAAFESAI